MRDRIARAAAAGGLAIALVSSTYLIARAQSTPALPMVYSGQLTDDEGTPLTGTRSIGLRLWGAETTGVVRCAAAPVPVELDDGHFTLPLDPSCSDAVRSSSELWLEVVVDGEALPRTRLGAVPFAVFADRASSALDADRAAVADEVDLQCRTVDSACTADGAGNMVYLDRQAPQCGDGELMQGFQLIRCNASTGVFYRLTCCR